MTMGSQGGACLDGVPRPRLPSYPMPNLFLYVGTAFLREDGEERNGIQGEAAFALNKLLPKSLTWQTVHNVHEETTGDFTKKGTRQFKYSSNGALGGVTLK